jgi:hypothetical protein
MSCLAALVLERFLYFLHRMQWAELVIIARAFRELSGAFLL